MIHEYQHLAEYDEVHFSKRSGYEKMAGRNHISKVSNNSITLTVVPNLVGKLTHLSRVAVALLCNWLDDCMSVLYWDTQVDKRLVEIGRI